MAWYRKPKTTVYVVIRLDTFASGEGSVTVKEAVHDEATAMAEVRRLNELNAERGARYFYQATRLFPPGYSAGSSPTSGDQPPTGPAA
jgi:hypothetical protein